jgi:hypothetical protein
MTLHAPAQRPAGAPPAPGRPRRPALLAVLVLVVAVITAGLVLALGPSGAQTSESTGTALPDGAQSAEVERRLAASAAGQELPALVVVSRVDGGPLTPADRTAVAERAAELAAAGQPGPPVEPQLSPGGEVATISVLVPGDLSTRRTPTPWPTCASGRRRTCRRGCRRR